MEGRLQREPITSTLRSHLAQTRLPCYPLLRSLLPLLHARYCRVRAGKGLIMCPPPWSATVVGRHPPWYLCLSSEKQQRETQDCEKSQNTKKTSPGDARTTYLPLPPKLNTGRFNSCLVSGANPALGETVGHPH